MSALNHVPNDITINNYEETSTNFWRCMTTKGYELGQVLGKGRTCVVVQAINKKNKGLVAVKVIDKLHVRSQYYEEKLPKELSLWSKMRHPNIIKLIGSASDVRWTYCIMEHSPEGDLDNWLLTNDHVGQDLSRKWACQLASALCYLKKLGVAHGDVKPKNILVVGEKHLKLCDFGCMRPITGGSCRSFCGSFGYVAPEVYRKEPFDEEKADVWSFGVTVYNLLTHGLITYRSTSCVHRLKRNWLNTLPTEARPLFLGIFQRKPENRINLDEVEYHPWLQEELSCPEPVDESGSPLKPSSTITTDKTVATAREHKSGVNKKLGSVYQIRGGSPSEEGEEKSLLDVWSQHRQQNNDKFKIW